MQYKIKDTKENQELHQALVHEAARRGMTVTGLVTIILRSGVTCMDSLIAQYWKATQQVPQQVQKAPSGFDIADVIKDLEKKPKLTDRLKKRDPEAQTYIDRGLLCIDDSVRAEIAEAISKLGDKEAMDYLDSTGHGRI